MTQQQLKKRIEDLETRTGTAEDGAAKIPDAIMFVAQMPDGTQWPQEPYNREDFNIVTSPRGPEFWHPKNEVSEAAIDRYHRILEEMREEAQKAD